MIHSQQTIRGTKGFSLVELLAAVIVITILAATLLPALGAMSKKHKSTTCLSNLRALSQGVALFVAENNMTYPSHYLNPSGLNAWYAPLIGTGFGYAPLVEHRGAGKKKNPYFCPENPASLKSGNGQWTNYAMNYFLIGAKTSIVSGVKVLLFDAYIPGGSPETWYVNQGGVDLNGNPKKWSGINPVHGDYINVSFTDGHAKAVRIKPGVESTRDLNELKGIWFWPRAANAGN